MSQKQLSDASNASDDARAVEDIDVTGRDGELLGIVDPAGCGKSAARLIFAGLEAWAPRREESGTAH